MERDFMGLSSRDTIVVVKEEAVEDSKDPVFSKSAAIQWPMSSASFNGRQASEIQKSVNHHGHGGTHFSMTTYPVQQTNQAFPVAMSNPFLRTHFSGVPMKQQLLGGVPVTAPHSALPCMGSVAGMTEPWFNSKTASAPAQLTIFYGGMVNVYDDISPEKAQAIMFLAGNGSTAASNAAAQARAQVQVHQRNQVHAAQIGSKVEARDVYVHQHINTSPCSALSSPMSVSSHPLGVANSGEHANKGSVAPVCIKVETPRIASSLGPMTATTMMPSAVPQARKASLARFLEKRKERVMASAPYNGSKNAGECLSKTVPNGAVLASGSGVGECGE